MNAKLLPDLHFDNRFVRELPADPISSNYCRQVEDACYSFVNPTPVIAPQLVCAAKDVADLIELDHGELGSASFVKIFSGNQQLTGMQPHACCYGGHQFGNWAGQLGDGRAINLGEVKNSKGEHWTLQLKGAGPTPYSRNADGLAVLRSSVREFLCSEAMHYLGVPTTRALSILLTGEQVKRDMFYNGNPKLEPGAVVCRVAPSFTRFGNFEILAARHDVELLKGLADFTIRADFPHLIPNNNEIKADTYVQWFTDICKRTAQMIAHWMRVGFVHGVMNTDNMSILGLTIDYGPYGWLEGYEPDWTPNTTDAQGRRYRFINQPKIALWNLTQFANAIYPLVESVEPLQDALNVYRTEYEAQWQRDMANKLGLHEFEKEDVDLVGQLQQVLQATETDMTIFFRTLANFDAQVHSTVDTRNDEALVSVITAAYYNLPSAEAIIQMAAWLRVYRLRLIKDYLTHGEQMVIQRKIAMDKTNPKYVLRNYMAQQAIDKASGGDYSEVQKLLALLRDPYAEQPEHEHYFARRPDWARNKAGCSMLSCSS